MGWEIFALIGLMVASTVASIMLQQKPSVEGTQPGEVEASMAEEGGNIPVLFGTRDIANQNVVWYGDIRITAIKKSSGGKK